MSKSAEEWAREALMTFREGGLVDHFAATIRAAVEEEREACARVSSAFTLRADRSIHPDIPWDRMSESVKVAAHTTAQQIADAIRSRSTTGGEGE